MLNKKEAKLIKQYVKLVKNLKEENEKLQDHIEYLYEALSGSDQ